MPSRTEATKRYTEFFLNSTDPTDEGQRQHALAQLPLVLFTGSRDWPNFPRVYNVMDDLIDVLGSYRVVQGGARGLDTFADVCAKILHLESHTEHPRYDIYGRAAPKIRNTTMLMMQPDLVVAFWREGSSTGGTIDCIDKAVNAFRYPLLLYRR